MNKIQELYRWPEEKPDVPAFNHTWCKEHNLELFKAFIPKDAETIVELGTWLGGSARVICDLFQRVHVYTIDNYGKSRDFSATELIPEIEPYLGRLRDLFIVSNWDYRDQITQVNETTIDGMVILKTNGIEPELIYVDADHSFECAYIDTVTAHKLWPNARLIGDDYNLPGVKKAVDKFAKANSMAVKNNHLTWALIK